MGWSGWSWCCWGEVDDAEGCWFIIWGDEASWVAGWLKSCCVLVRCPWPRILGSILTFDGSRVGLLAAAALWTWLCWSVALCSFAESWSLMSLGSRLLASGVSGDSVASSALWRCAWDIELWAGVPCKLSIFATEPGRVSFMVNPVFDERLPESPLPVVRTDFIWSPLEFFFELFIKLDVWLDTWNCWGMPDLLFPPPSIEFYPIVFRWWPTCIKFSTPEGQSDWVEAPDGNLSDCIRWAIAPPCPSVLPDIEVLWPAFALGLFIFPIDCNCNMFPEALLDNLLGFEGGWLFILVDGWPLPKWACGGMVFKLFWLMLS